jgi:hypothetical protein
MTSVFLPMYLEPRNAPTNPHWCPYAKGSPREGRTPQMSNSVESWAFSTRKWCSASDSSRTLLVVSTIELPAKMPRASFPPVHGGTVTQTRLSWSRKTLSSLGTIIMARTRAKDFVGSSKLTPLTRNCLEQAHKRSN